MDRSVSRRALAVAGLASLVAVAFAAPASAAPVAARWSVTMANVNALTGPDLGDGRVYVGLTQGADAGGVRALSAATGATLWTRNLPRPVTAAPDFAPGANLVYAATDQRVYALNPATGAIVKSGPINGFGEAPGVLRAADGRVYVETLHDIFGFNAALVQQWDYFLDDDPAAISAPGDGFVYLNDEDQVGGTGFPQCMEKVNGATGVQAARNCKVDDFIAPTAVPAKSSVVGAGSAGIFNFRPSNLSIKWVNKGFPLLGAASGTADQGGRVAAAGGATYALLRMSDGHEVCHAAFAGKQFGFIPPVFAPGTAASYVFDGSGQSVVKVSGSCAEAWTFAAGADLIGLRATSSTVVGTAATKVFALEP
jgi:outer membrane protein assembly factor BamB